MMMSVLQDIKGVTKELYFIIFQEEVQFPCTISGPLFNINMYGLHFNMTSFFQEVKGLTICPWTTLDGNLLTYKVSSSLVLWLVSSKEEDEEEESVKIIFSYFV